MLDPQDFINHTWAAASHPPGEIDLSQYAGAPYPCACGRLHILDGSREALLEMESEEPRVVLACPEMGHDALTLVQLRRGFANRAMSEVGCLFESDPVEIRQLQTG